MRRSAATLSSAALIAGLLCAPAFADDDDDHRGWRHRGGHEYKEKYWDRGCRVEREFRRDGSYREERDCGGRRRGHGGPHPAHAAAWSPGWAPPAHGPWSGPYPAHAPVVEVHPYPPAVVVRPPVIVIR